MVVGIVVYSSIESAFQGDTLVAPRAEKPYSFASGSLSRAVRSLSSCRFQWLPSS